MYLNQLTEDEIHLELKNCLSAEARKVADLLDSSSDTSKLSVIVRQVHNNETGLFLHRIFIKLSFIWSFLCTDDASSAASKSVEYADKRAFGCR